MLFLVFWPYNSNESKTHQANETNQTKPSNHPTTQPASQIEINIWDISRFYYVWSVASAKIFNFFVWFSPLNHCCCSPLSKSPRSTTKMSSFRYVFRALNKNYWLLSLGFGLLEASPQLPIKNIYIFCVFVICHCTFSSAVLLLALV